MDEAGGHMTGRILKLTLEIIYLLTGEDYVPARKSYEDVKDGRQPCMGGELHPSNSPAPEEPRPSSMEELKNDQKILELTKKMIKLLTGEVPLRYDDIIVCFSMEEWDYVDGHKDLYMDVIQEPSVAAADGSPLHVPPDDNNGDCDGQNPRNPCEPGEALNSSQPEIGANPIAETIPKETKHEYLPMEEAPPINEERHRKESGSYSSPRLPVSEYSSLIKEESDSGEESPYRVTPAQQEDYLYATEDRDKLTIAACSVCGDRFTVESEDAAFERLRPYRCQKCDISNWNSTDFEEMAALGVSEVPGTADLAETYGDREEGNIDCQRSVANRKHLEINGRRKTCSSTKWGGCPEGDAPLDGHNATPEDGQVFICPQCGKSFSHQASLALHQKAHMAEKTAFISQSGKYLRNKASQQAGGKQYDCADSGKTFKRSLNLVEHEQSHIGEKTLACPDCGQRFPQRAAYVAHRKVHRAGKLHFCFECEKSFRTKADLTTHQRIHMGETPFPCPQCGESFTRRANLLRHQRIHTGEKPFSCPDCGKRFTRKLGLMKHQRLHSAENVYKGGCRKNGFSMCRVIV